jgi:hypothetical protein
MSQLCRSPACLLATAFLENYHSLLVLVTLLLRLPGKIAQQALKGGLVFLGISPGREIANVPALSKHGSPSGARLHHLISQANREKDFRVLAHPR